MIVTPSSQQLEAFTGLPAAKPVVLFYEFSHDDPAADEACAAALGAAAVAHRGRLLWEAEEEQVLVGALALFRRASQLEFAARADAAAFVQSGAHAEALRRCAALRVTVLSRQPRLLAVLSAVLARVLPWVPFDNATDDSEEPGIGRLRIMPTAEAVAALKAHPQQDAPVVMINWLKFRPVARYADSAGGISGRDAYLRYGKVALRTTHSIGAKLLYAARYRQVLIGNGGDPAVNRWDEFALMQYPGRRAFHYMTALRRYRRGLADREAGLAEEGQGLTVSRPLPHFVWRR